LEKLTPAGEMYLVRVRFRVRVRVTLTLTLTLTGRDVPVVAAGGALAHAPSELRGAAEQRVVDPGG